MKAAQATWSLSAQATWSLAAQATWSLSAQATWSLSTQFSKQRFSLKVLLRSICIIWNCSSYNCKSVVYTKYGWPEPYISTHRIWLYIWWLPYQNNRTYTVYTWFWPTLFIPSTAWKWTQVCWVIAYQLVPSPSFRSLVYKAPQYTNTYYQSLVYKEQPSIKHHTTPIPTTDHLSIKHHSTSIPTTDHLSMKHNHV